MSKNLSKSFAYDCTFCWHIQKARQTERERERERERVSIVYPILLHFLVGFLSSSISPTKALELTGGAPNHLAPWIPPGRPSSISARFTGNIVVISNFLTFFQFFSLPIWLLKAIKFQTFLLKIRILLSFFSWVGFDALLGCWENLGIWFSGLYN